MNCVSGTIRPSVDGAIRVPTGVIRFSTNVTGGFARNRISCYKWNPMAIQIKGPFVAGNTLLVLVLGSTAWGQSPETGNPRTADGHLDFQGIWNSASDKPLERPASLGNREFFSPSRKP
jgi:hypothetical protein